MKDAILKRRADRFRFLHALYDAVGGVRHSFEKMYPLGESLGLEKNETGDIVGWLKDQGLLEFGGGGMVGLTHLGITEVEHAVTKPNEPGEKFPAFNIIKIDSMNNSVIQQGTANTMQGVSVSAEATEAVKAVVAEVRKFLESTPLSAALRAGITADIDTVEAQLRSPDPKRSILREGLLSLRAMLEEAGGALIASKVGEAIAALSAGAASAL